MNAPVTPETVVSASPDAIMSDVDGEIMLISVVTGSYFGLDAIASEIWRGIQTPVSVADLSAGLAAKFKGDADVIARETLDFVTKLADRGLVTQA